jgi:hypothetical protein
MTTAISIHEAFNTAAAPGIAASIDSALLPAPDAGRSKRFAYFADGRRLLVVAGAQEERQVELALAYGLHWRGDRELLLALPAGMSTATQQRVPWLRSGDRPALWEHDGSVARPLTLMQQTETVRAVESRLAGLTPGEEFRRASTAHHLGERAAWVTGLVDAVTQDSRLDPAHRQGERSWHHRGQRVLSMSRSRSGVKVQAGIHHSAADRGPTEWLLDGPLTEAERDDVRAAVEVAISERASGDDKAIRRDDEHLLQSVIRRHPEVAGIEQMAMREAPAWRPMDKVGGWTRGFIDLLGLDGNGDIVIAETKIEKNADPLFVLQGLDYFVWGTAYREALVQRLGAASTAKIQLNLVVGAATEANPRLPEYTRSLAAALDEAVPCSTWNVHDWAEPQPHPTGVHSGLLE